MNNQSKTWFLHHLVTLCNHEMLDFPNGTSICSLSALVAWIYREIYVKGVIKSHYCLTVYRQLIYTQLISMARQIHTSSFDSDRIRSTTKSITYQNSSIQSSESQSIVLLHCLHEILDYINVSYLLSRAVISSASHCENCRLSVCHIIISHVREMSELKLIF